MGLEIIPQYSVNWRNEWFLFRLFLLHRFLFDFLRLLALFTLLAFNFFRLYLFLWSWLLWLFNNWGSFGIIFGVLLRSDGCAIVLKNFV